MTVLFWQIRGFFHVSNTPFRWSECTASGIFLNNSFGYPYSILRTIFLPGGDKSLRFEFPNGSYRRFAILLWGCLGQSISILSYPFLRGHRFHGNPLQISNMGKKLST